MPQGADREEMKNPGTIIKKLFNYETVSYFIAGVMTTAVDYAVYILVNEALKRGGMEVAGSATLASAVSWFAAVFFAYIVNKLIVFRSFNLSPSYIIKECSVFFAARIISGLITLAMIWVMTGVFHMNEYIAKIFTSAVNMVLNYVASKIYIFKK